MGWQRNGVNLTPEQMKAIEEQDAKAKAIIETSSRMATVGGFNGILTGIDASTGNDGALVRHIMKSLTRFLANPVACRVIRIDLLEEEG